MLLLGRCLLLRLLLLLQLLGMSQFMGEREPVSLDGIIISCLMGEEEEEEEEEGVVVVVTGRQLTISINLQKVGSIILFFTLFAK
jgi:hypothetical protein